MDGGDREPMEWKEDERTSELAGEWIELEFMMIDNRIITISSVFRRCVCVCCCFMRTSKRRAALISIFDVMCPVQHWSSVCVLCSIGRSEALGFGLRPLSLKTSY